MIVQWASAALSWAFILESLQCRPYISVSTCPKVFCQSGISEMGTDELGVGGDKCKHMENVGG